MKESFGGWGEASAAMGENVEFVGGKVVEGLVEWREERVKGVKKWVGEIVGVDE